MLSAVSLPVSFEPVERSISIDTELPETDATGAPAEWVAWGCHGFLRNTDALSQANARVAFRRLGDGEVYEEVLRTVPAAALGLMPLGSVWQGNRSERQVVLTTRTFDVDHAEGHWSFTSFAEAAETGGAPPFPRKRVPPHESAEHIRYLDTAEPELVAVPEFEGDVSGAEALSPRVRLGHISTPRRAGGAVSW